MFSSKLIKKTPADVDPTSYSKNPDAHRVTQSHARKPVLPLLSSSFASLAPHPLSIAVGVGLKDTQSSKHMLQ
jgi:hypothetical protein